MEDCIFCKIIKKEIPAEIIYEDEEIIAFKDIHPAAPIHILVIPKKHFSNLLEVQGKDQNIISEIYLAINKIAKEQGFAEDGFRVIVNCGKDGGQEVGHLHFHILGGKYLGPKIVH